MYGVSKHCPTAGDVSTSVTEETFTSKKEGAVIASQTLTWWPTWPTWSSFEELECRPGPGCGRGLLRFVHDTFASSRIGSSEEFHHFNEVRWTIKFNVDTPRS